jgi:predicted transposase/invertase (TIGR01784 family)
LDLNYANIDSSLRSLTLDDLKKNSLKPNSLPEKIYLSPLADPVVGAIFQNERVSALAMKSLVNAVLADSDDPLIGDVIKVISQSTQSGGQHRSYRIDVEAITNAGEFIIFEVQMASFRFMNERLLFYAESVLAAGAIIGDKLEDVISKSPKVIALTILNFDLVQTGPNFHQVGEIIYREKPRAKLTDKLEIHHLILPKFRNIKPDLTKPLHLWLEALCLSIKNEETLEDIVKNNKHLSDFYNTDHGFAQFVDRYGLVASDSETKTKYKRWLMDVYLEAENLRCFGEEKRAEGRAEGVAKGRAEGVAKGRAEGVAEGVAKGRAEEQMKIALAAFSKAKSDDDYPAIIETLKEFSIEENIIERALDNVKAKLEN